jgi:hypothetical protein
MPSMRSVIPERIDCATCLAQIPEYVEQELAHQPVAQRFAGVAFHLGTCPACEAAYYREFRRQGLAKPLAELQQLGQRAAVADVMEQILGRTPATATPSGWREELWAYGRAWRDRATGGWRQVEVLLSNLGSAPDTGPPLALAGLQGGQDEPTAPEGTVQLAPEGAQFELRVAVLPEPEGSAGDLSRVALAVTLYDRFGDYGGVAVTLQFGEVVLEATTDALGKVEFGGLPRDQLAAMRLVVTLPD